MACFQKTRSYVYKALSARRGICHYTHFSTFIDLPSADLLTFTSAKKILLYSYPSVTMCIQWCCKLCSDKLTKLTHDLALERCYEYCMARSQDQSIMECPKGPPVLRRAFHRHPVRGAQRCNDCVMVARRKNKLVQLAQQRANIALGKPPEYAGALDLGVLEIPEDFNHYAEQQILELGKMDAMNSKWWSVSLANGRMAPNQLEDERAKRSTEYDKVDPNTGGAWVVQPLKVAAGTLGQQGMSEEDRSRVRTLLVGGVSENLHQHVHQISQSSNGKYETSRSVHQQVQADAISTNWRTAATAVGQEASRSLYQYPAHHTKPSECKPLQTTQNADQQAQHSATPIMPFGQEASRSAHQAQHNANPTFMTDHCMPIRQEASPSSHYSQHLGNSDTGKRKFTSVEEAASRFTHYRWIHYNTTSGAIPSKQTDITKQQAFSQNSNHEEAHYDSTSTTDSSPSTIASRARPWDL